MGWSVAPAVLPADPKGGDPPVDYGFLTENNSFAIVRSWLRRGANAFQVSAVDVQGRTVDAASVMVPASFAKAYPFKRLISVPVTFGEEWSGRIFIFDPKIDVHLVSLARFLQMIVRQIGPALLSVYLLERLRMRAGAMERARVARELHDGVIQSLIGAEMQLEVLRSSQLKGTPAAGELSRLQGILRNEVLNLRELMQQMRPPDVDPDELLDYIADMVQRFGRDTGITARFVTDLRQVALPRHVCFELVRIVQEGLVNVRKHSAATSVTVRFSMRNGFWTLEIDDDGKGFPFEGRLSQNDLDEQHSGPDIIKERVRSIGGQLAIDSAPGRGARLEVLVPQEGR
jgi:signal transduction histidine kinase